MNYPLADAHVEFIHHPDDERDLPDPTVTHHQITPDQIEQVRPELLFLACWVEPNGDAWAKLNYIIDGYRQVIVERGWHLVDKPADLNRPGIKIILHLEDAAAINPDMADRQLDVLFSKGIRSVGLTHNPVNQYAGGALTNDGLTAAGEKLIRQILRRGALLDWAHLGPRSIHDVAAHFPDLKPFISHTGLRSVYDTPRNIGDATLELVRDRGGWLGLGLARGFLSDNKPTLVDYARQNAYATKIVGQDHVGVGSDLGGVISGLPVGLDSWSKIRLLKPTLANPDQAGRTLIRWLSNNWHPIPLDKKTVLQ